MAKFTRKETRVAGILLDLVNLIPRFDRRNPKPTFPTWNTKKKRYSTRRSRFAGAKTSKLNLFPKNVVFTPSPDSPLLFPRDAGNPSRRRSDGIAIDLNKNPDDDREQCGIDRGFKDGIFIDKNRGSEKGVMKMQYCRKRKREDSMITLTQNKKMTV